MSVRAYALQCCLVLLAGLIGCSGKSRSFGDVSGSAGTEDPGTEVGELQPAEMGTAGAGPVVTAGEAGPTVNGIPARSAGAACVTSADCDAPTSCVDGVCCTSACTELCAACNVPGSVGTCSAAPSDEACGALLCAGFDTECRQLDTTQLTLNCQGFGTCKVNAECAVLAEASGATCQAGAGACDGSGACLVAGKAALGEACTTNDECAEGHCVQPAAGGTGLCCDAACDGACQTCSPEGHCEQTPDADTRCEAVACPPDDVCNDYTADVIASQCRSFGQCQTGRDCPSLPLRPAAECECDAGTGACLLRGGASCTQATECSSGVCGANGQGAAICCASACPEGQFCSADGSACVACEGTSIACDGNTQRRCDAGTEVATDCPNGCTPGTGCNGLPPLGFPCDAGQCAAPNVCQPDVAGAQRCCARDCAAEGKVCAENGSCACQPGQVAAGDDCLLQAGDPCQTAAECQTGLACTDGVCCQEACNGTCEACQPNTGLCVAVAAGQQDVLCGAGRQCTGTRGDCRSLLRQPCSGDSAECVTDACEPTVGNATQICCAAACTLDRPFCRSNGQGCVQCETDNECGNGCNTQTGTCNALLPTGALCGASSQCTTGQCNLDQSQLTRCCESNCGARGLVCDAGGRCVVPTVGAGQPCTPGAVNCAGSLQCINGTCQIPTVGQGAACGAQANCDTQTGLTCVNGLCNCRAEETLDRNGRCSLRDGETCQTPSDCASGLCTRWLADADADGFGSEPTVNGHPAVLICGDNSPANRPPPFEGSGCRGPALFQYESDPAGRIDCCDQTCNGALGIVPSTAAYPGNLVPGTTSANCAPGIFTADFNCDGEAELTNPEDESDLRPPCTEEPRDIPSVECSARSGFRVLPECGVARARQTCVLINGLCSNPPAAAPPPEVPSCR